MKCFVMALYPKIVLQLPLDDLVKYRHLCKWNQGRNLLCLHQILRVSVRIRYSINSEKHARF